MTNVTHWHGTEEQFKRLAEAISRHCTCQEMQKMCSAHSMLTDQAMLDRLAFAGYLSEFYEKREWRK